MSTDAMLPTEFSDLEPFAPVWACETEPERYDRRLASSMDELQAFYDAIFPRAKAALDFLDTKDLDDLSDQELNLLRMLYSLSTISFAVDCFKQPKIPDSGSAYLRVISEPVP
jgi:hypothetical protein